MEVGGGKIRDNNSLQVHKNHQQQDYMFPTVDLPHHRSSLQPVDSPLLRHPIARQQKTTGNHEGSDKARKDSGNTIEHEDSGS